jgi:hypothetical protein
MIDMVTTQTMATKLHPHWSIFATLIGLSLTSALLAGIAMASSTSDDWLHILGFAVAMVLTVYIILDIEYPQVGLLWIAAFDQVLVELRESMK